ncbi:FecR family protein [Pedobacter frigoris]|uniref:FecR family protein n=1 Tax=Pedobacter frigoris TaxID=2571272 RepID=UPI00292E9EE0|nr:FecR domain-containing protein [Pedobacter frigoris]
MQHPDLRDLTQNEQFLNYCFRNNLEDIEYWEKWISDNPAYKNEVDEVKNAVLLLAGHIGNAEVETQFEKLNHQIYKQNINKTKRQINLSIWKKLSAAAIFAVIVGAGFYFYWNKQNNNSYKNEYVRDVLPGSNKAVLTLADGRQISLGDEKNGTIASQAGIKIIKTANGKLLYDLSGATGDAASPQMNTLTVPVGGQWQLILPDQTEVWLNAESSISYPTKFTGNERQIKITGEAYLEVAHNKAMPFKVESKGQIVEVLGTHFNIMAYADEQIVKTTLLEGAIKVSVNGKSKLMQPGQQAQVGLSGINMLDDVDLSEVIAWKNGDFSFNERLESVMSKIARWYDVEIIYQYKPDHDIFLGKISRSRKLSSILKMLEYNGDVHFKIEGRKIIVSK